jgi:hypothetical protein
LPTWRAPLDRIEMETPMPEPASFQPATFADSAPRDQPSFTPSNIRTDPLR